MSEAAESLLATALDLPIDERLGLAEALIESTRPPGELPFDESWIAIARQRAERVRSGLAETIPWAEVQREAREAVGG